MDIPWISMEYPRNINKSFLWGCSMPAALRRPQKNTFLLSFMCSLKGINRENIWGNIIIHFFNEKSDLGVIWQLGGPGSVQNTPTRCGNNFHTRQTQFQEIIVWQNLRISVQPGSAWNLTILAIQLLGTNPTQIHAAWEKEFPYWDIRG